MPDETFPQPTLIAGYDGSAESNDALVLAEALAEATGDRVLVAGSCDGPRAAARFLRNLAELEDASAVVLGSSRRGAVGRVLPGSVTEQLLHDAPCAVAVAPRGLRECPPAEPRVIGVAFDGYPESWCALERAREIAEGCGAALRVTAVIEGDGVRATGSTSMYGVPGAVVVDERERLEQAMADALHSLPARVRAQGVVRRGAPVDVLVDTAETGIDLLVVGSRGYGPLRRVVLGSVSNALVRSAPCPVMVVPRCHPAPVVPATADHAHAALRAGA